MKNECCLMNELLPLFAEDIVSEEASEIIKMHIENCPECREKLSFFKENDDIINTPQEEEIKPFKKILKKTNRLFSALCCTVIILFLFIGVSFSDWGENMLKSIAVMPAAGAFGYVLFRYKALYKLPLMLLITEAAAFVIGFVERDIYMIGLNMALACLFIFIGFLIAMLIHFAFRKDSKKLFLKITSFCTAWVLITGMCFLTNAIAGNPVSRRLAVKNIHEYIETNYQGQGYQITDIRYDYLSSSYVASVEVPGSPDRHFGVSAGLDGKVKDKNPENNSRLIENTADRIKEAYSDAVDEVFDNPAFQYPQASCFATIEFALNEEERMVPYAILYEELEPDMLFDIDEFGARAGYISIEIWENNLTEEYTAEIMLHAKSLLDKSGIEFNSMDCTIRNPDTEEYEVFSVDNFPSSEIYEEGMAERVRLAANKT